MFFPLFYFQISIKMPKGVSKDPTEDMELGDEEEEDSESEGGEDSDDQEMEEEKKKKQRIEVNVTNGLILV